MAAWQRLIFSRFLRILLALSWRLRSCCSALLTNARHLATSAGVAAAAAGAPPFFPLVALLALATLPAPRTLATFDRGSRAYAATNSWRRSGDLGSSCSAARRAAYAAEGLF